MTKEEYKKQYKDQIPHQPGVYKYYDVRKKILYIGKAKDLQKRVSQYFSSRPQDAKTAELVTRIKSIDFHVVNTENDALLMENNLIKSFKPPFNINLKDNKNYYPSIYIFDEDYPRVVLARKTPEVPIAEKYGPFTSISSAYSVIDYIRKNYKLRTCNLDLSPEKIAQKKYRPCLQYHIKKCTAPCKSFISQEQYDADIEEIKKILSGKLQDVQRYLKDELDKSVENLEFERAEELKNKLSGIKKYQSNSVIFSRKLKNLDVIAYVEEGDMLYFTYLQVENGKMIGIRQKEVHKQLNEDNESVLLHVLLSMRQEQDSVATEVVVQEEMDYALEGIEWTYPKIGDKRKLLELAMQNAQLLSNHIEPEVNLEENPVLRNIQEQLGLKNLPMRIECFDNSNIQGTSAVAGMVSYYDGQPDKSNYRKYKIKTVEGPDDFKSMYEVVLRRYRRQLAEYQELPDLIIIDGGKGQLSMAMKALEDLQIQDQVEVIGLAKKKEEIYKAYAKDPIHLEYDGPELALIRNIRDEVHRFGITFHRQTRSRKAHDSVLDTISGIGPKTKRKLLEKYKSVSRIQKASKEELEKLIGKEKALKILTKLSNKQLE